MNRIEGLRYRVRFGACALVAQSDLLYGIARMFSVLAETQFEQIRVFRDFLPAEFWIHSVREEPPKRN